MVKVEAYQMGNNSTIQENHAVSVQDQALGSMEGYDITLQPFSLVPTEKNKGKEEKLYHDVLYRLFIQDFLWPIYWLLHWVDFGMYS